LNSGFRKECKICGRNHEERGCDFVHVKRNEERVNLVYAKRDLVAV
jgi:recombinational DNA repair protein RecR